MEAVCHFVPALNHKGLHTLQGAQQLCHSQPIRPLPSRSHFPDRRALLQLAPPKVFLKPENECPWDIHWWVCLPPILGANVKHACLFLSWKQEAEERVLLHDSLQLLQGEEGLPHRPPSSNPPFQWYGSLAATSEPRNDFTSMPIVASFIQGVYFLLKGSQSHRTPGQKRPLEVVQSHCLVSENDGTCPAWKWKYQCLWSCSLELSDRTGLVSTSKKFELY